MKLPIPKLNIAPEIFFRQCGYQEIANPHKNNEISFARSLDPGRFYPRFHIYAEKADKGTLLNLHLDMKKPSYEGSAAHGGEYSGPTVEKETERIKAAAGKFILTASTENLGFKKSKSLLKKLLDYFS